jgi:hypothetical protein
VFAIVFSLNPALLNADLFASTTGIGVWALGWLLTVFAGALAGYLAKEDRFLHGFLVGGLGIILTLLIAFGGEAIGLDSLVGTLIAAPLAGVAAQFSRRTPAQQRK